MSDDDWMTWDEAAALVGCRVATIDWWKRKGRIRSRGNVTRSLDRASVEEFAAWWREQQAKRAARPPRRETGLGYQPPEPTGWISTKAAGELLGITAGEVVHRIHHGHLPGQRSSGRWWLREADIRARSEEEQGDLGALPPHLRLDRDRA